MAVAPGSRPVCHAVRQVGDWGILVEPIRILLVDDHTLFRHGIRALLASVTDIELVGEAATGEEAVAQAVALDPDVLLMDFRMPSMNGIEATRLVLRERPGIAVVVLTMLDDDDSVIAAMRAGARGYVVKGAEEEEMLRVIRAVAAGEALFGPAIAKRLMTFFGDDGPLSHRRPFPGLTDRERDVLGLIAQGYSNTDIASRLYVSPKTVRNHISGIFEKLQVTSRAQAIVRAREAGLGQ